MLGFSFDGVVGSQNQSKILLVLPFSSHLIMGKGCFLSSIVMEVIMHFNRGRQKGLASNLFVKVEIFAWLFHTRTIVTGDLFVGGACRKGSPIVKMRHGRKP